MKKLLLLVAAAVLVAGAALAAPVCDDDPDGVGPDTNACNCGTPAPPDPNNPPSDVAGCIAVGDVCLAGSLSQLQGCLSLGSGTSICSDGPGAVAACDSDADCAETADDGCGADD